MGAVFCRVAPMILTGAQRPFGNAPAPWRGSARSRRNLLEERREAPAIRFLRNGSPLRNKSATSTLFNLFIENTVNLRYYLIVFHYGEG